jgi:CxxC-x17-CxxC domain-containing protein
MRCGPHHPNLHKHSTRPGDPEFLDHCTSQRKGFMTIQDLQMTCSDCGQEFMFSGEDQAFFQERGYSAPKRCKACRQAKKNEQGEGGGYRSESQGTTVTCSGCGKPATVPFVPRGDRPVYCQDCFRSRKRDTSSRGGRSHRG